ncbi:MAG: sortase [Chloroflexi bacterium]|nr:sortase [Chloroflexota bacterium]
MPIQTRPIRSLLALALIVSLVVAGSPGAAFGHQPAAMATEATLPSAARPSPDAHEAAKTAPRVEAGGEDRDLYLRGPHSLDRPVVQRATLTNSPAPARVAWVTRATAPVPEPKAKAVSTAEAASGGSSGSGGSSANYTGRNHVWIPALGINKSVSAFACSSSAYPGDRVYRWGCAGSNNIYLFGHAYSVFKPLHDAYVRGRLSKGMKVIYADGNGKVSTYVVAWWKTTTPDKGAWAYAGQSRPSLTLQTCVGARSQYRLIVRLYKVG